MTISDKTRDILEWILCIVIAFVLAIVVKYFVGTPTIVSQVSMKPTLMPGQRLILNRWMRTINEMPQRGEIITFEAPSKVAYSNSLEVDLQNPIAKYEKEPTNWWSKFVYYVLEIGKESYIKRVIALEGEHVEIKDGKVYINGEEQKEEYLSSDVVTSSSGLTDFIVPEGYIFAMGDNRPRSTDCRAFGCIPVDKVEGVVTLRFWPLNLFGPVD